MSGGVAVTRAAPHVEMEETAPLALPQPAPPRRRRRDPQPCLVPDIDLVCDETLSEDDGSDDDDDATGEAIWTQLKDPARSSFWQDRITGGDSSIRRRPGPTSPHGGPAVLRSPPVKKRRVPDASETSREEHIRSAASSPAAPAELHCPSSPLSSSEDVQVGGRYDTGQGSSIHAANIRPWDKPSRRFYSARSSSSSNTDEQTSPASLSSWDVTRPALVVVPSIATEDQLAPTDDFHTVPEIEDSQPGFGDDVNYGHTFTDLYSWDEDDYLQVENRASIITADVMPIREPNYVGESTGNSEISSSNEEEANSSSFDDEHDVIGSFLDSGDQEYVIYSSQSSDDEPADVNGPRRPLASCDVTDHVVPNKVIEE